MKNAELENIIAWCKAGRGRRVALADASGVTKQYVSQLCAGLRSNPTLETMRKLKDGFAAAKNSLPPATKAELKNRSPGDSV